MELSRQSRLKLGQRVLLSKMTRRVPFLRTTSTKLIEFGKVELVPTWVIHSYLPMFKVLWYGKVLGRLSKEKNRHQPKHKGFDLQYVLPAGYGNGSTKHVGQSSNG